MAKAPKKHDKARTDTAPKKRRPVSQNKSASAADSGAFSPTELQERLKARGAEIIEPGARPNAPFQPDARDPEDTLDFTSAQDIEINPDHEIDVPPGAIKTVTPEIIESKASTSKSLAPADPVATYLAEIRRYPLLTKEQERELAIRYRETGDPTAAEALVTSNLRFVVKIAAEYTRFGAKLIDLIQEGNVGLMHAVKEFNPYKGVRLITYAVWWIRGYIQEYLMRQYSLVRIGTTQNQRKLFYRLQKEREALGALGVEASNALLAGRLGVTEEEVETMSKRLAGRDISLNQPIDGESSTASLLDFEPIEAPGVDEQIGHLEEMEVLKENLDKIRPDLNEKELYILDNRILADDPMTLQEIGEQFGVTREAVRQLEARLIGKIRSAVTSSLDPNKGEP